MHLLHLLYIISLWTAVGCTKKEDAEDKNPPPPTAVRTVNVSNATALKAALADARPGDDIILADGVYKGRFVIEPGKDGTAAQPIRLSGSRNAILDGESINTGYVLYLQSSCWTVKGISITNGLKGIMADGITNTIVDSVKVYSIGEEAIHLRKFSSHNTIQNTEITNAGLKTPDYGEGIYIGSAKSNWATYSGGNPDLCDSNLVINNRIGPGITAECIDIKEGTTGGIVRGNYFDATGITGANSADSWMDVKGNYYLIENNTGFNPAGSLLTDGYQVNVAYSGWGSYNTFKNNVCNVNAPGYGFNIRLTSSNGTAVGNKVYTSNTVNGAVKGISNIPLSN